MAKKLVIVAAGLALFGIITLGGIEITFSSWFCISCHEMKELGNNWKFSKHGPYNAANPKMHNCMKCHSQPGLVGLFKAKVTGLLSLVYHITGNYHFEAAQPIVCIRDGCHQLEDMDRAIRPDKTVNLNHLKHIKLMQKVGTRNQCMPCHRRIAHGEATHLPDMKKDCFGTCHTNQDINAAKCTSCHPAHLGIRFEGKEVSLLDLHPEVACIECHEGFCRSSESTCEQCHEGKGYGNLSIIRRGKNS